MKKQKLSGGDLFKNAVVQDVISYLQCDDIRKMQRKELVQKALAILDVSLDWGSWGGLVGCEECGDKKHKTDPRDERVKKCRKCKAPVCGDCVCSHWRQQLNHLMQGH